MNELDTFETCIQVLANGQNMGEVDMELVHIIGEGFSIRQEVYQSVKTLERMAVGLNRSRAQEIVRKHFPQIPKIMTLQERDRRYLEIIAELGEIGELSRSQIASQRAHSEAMNSFAKYLVAIKLYQIAGLEVNPDKYGKFHIA